MPKNLKGTYLVDVVRTHYNKLTPEFIREDTETVDGKLYQLPRTELIILKLYTDGRIWQTVRRYTAEKYEYYYAIQGLEVEIVIQEK